MRVLMKEKDKNMAYFRNVAPERRSEKKIFLATDEWSGGRDWGKLYQRVYMVCFLIHTLHSRRWMEAFIGRCDAEDLKLRGKRATKDE